MKTRIIDFKLFATQTTLLSATGNDLSPEMKTFYTKRLLEDGKPNFVYSQFAEKYNIPKHGGKTIEFRKASRLAPATTALTEGVTPAGNKLNVTKFTKTISQYGDYIEQSDILETTAIDDTVVMALNLLSDQATETLDIITRNEVCGGTQVIYAPKIVEGASTAVTVRTGLDATSTISLDLIMDAVNLLKRKNVSKINGDYICILHTDIAHDIMRSAEWKEIHKYSNPEPIYNGEIGKVHGVRFIETTNAPVWDSTVNVYGCVVFGAQAYGETEVDGLGLEVIVKNPGSGNTSDPLNQRSTVGWKATKVAARLSEEKMVRIECTSTKQDTITANAS